MGQNQIMILGDKDSFIIRVLTKKLIDASLDVINTPMDVEEIDKHWADTALVTFYMEKDERLPDDIKTFLIDHLEDDDKRLIFIGEPIDVAAAEEGFPAHLIYKKLSRPLDYDEYISCVNSYNRQANAGELRKRILVVDDDVNFLNVMREWLEADYKISMATSGMRAIRWLAANKVDLILLDYEMPVTDGHQVLEMLRSEEDTKNIPVIFLTGNDSKETVMSVVNLKPQGYFLKTMPREEFLNKIKVFFMERAV
ncbi:response regulator [Pseudobutyrivibrio xylanivorans]|uniref:Stage 0 sporulation protein A homolog n=1 Tax=Pseudobutyrivibrio xylanivorans DSM 14809 TaxID=1123012 RepID=A0A1M6DXD0_PSEXY|nr:response regulator [Pseudobutyrivibrio xylanivorans]SHI77825.1 Response regulator receiver domain-containing protein [Pseudobutyrivibrio xylanivorans DSM 14809]